MTILLVQTFLLLLGAFLLGASLACLVRRAFAGRQPEPVIVGGSPGYAAAPASQAVVHAGDADRFGRALTGGYEAAPLQPATGPVIEVQPRPPVRVSPLIEPVDVPAPPAETPAAPVAAAPEPAVEAAPQPEPVPASEPEEASAGQSYTQVALAVAAGAAAAAAARGLASQAKEPSADDTAVAAAFAGTRADVDGADLNTYTEIASGEPSGVDASDFAEVARSARPDESEARDDAAQVEPAAVADLGSEPDKFDGPSYTEIAIAGAGLAAAAGAHIAANDDNSEAADDTADVSEVDDLLPDADTPPAVLATEGDDLTRIRSIDAGLRGRLNRLGVTRFAEIGGWSASDLTHFSQSLGVVPGRIEQENWVGQAQVLASGGVTDYGRGRGSDVTEKAALPADGERLHRIIGIDPESEAVLRENGVTRLTEIAAWTEDDIFLYEDALGAPGRIGRENWVEQARFLTRGSSVASAIESVSAPLAGAAAAAAVVAAIPSEVEAEPASETDDTVAVEDEADAPSAEAAAGETEGSDPAAAFSGPRSEAVAGLRSVRSEALRGSGSGFGTPVTGDVDDLKRIRGIGVLIEKKLHSLGVISYEQVANWTGEDIDRISQLLDFKGRIERENWIEQARILASGGQTEFSRRVDRGEV